MNGGVWLSSVVEAGGSVHSSGPSRCSNSLFKRAEVGGNPTWVLLRFGTPVRSLNEPGRHGRAARTDHRLTRRADSRSGRGHRSGGENAFGRACGPSAQNVSVVTPRDTFFLCSWLAETAHRITVLAVCGVCFGGPRVAKPRCHSQRPSPSVIPSSSISPPQRPHCIGGRSAGSVRIGCGGNQYVQPRHIQANHRASASCSLQFGLMNP